MATAVNFDDHLPLEADAKDVWFNPYRCPATARCQALVHEVLENIQAREARKRIRDLKAQQRFEFSLTALVSDLAYFQLTDSPGKGLVVSRAKKELGKETRYQPLVFTRSFPRLLDSIASSGLGYLTQEIGHYSGVPGQSKRTTVRPGRGLVSLIDKHGITFDDLRLSDEEEVIILKRSKKGYEDEGGRAEYEDTPTTKRLRDDVRSINRWLENADIRFDPPAHTSPVDARARRLYRYFAEEKFDRGGRLFKGFWENLPKQARRRGIIIEGERVCELDYAQLNPTLAYAAVDASAASGDAYTLQGLEKYRDGVKKIFNALLFDKGPREKFPKKVKALFPPKIKINDVITAIHKKHPGLASVLSKGIGFQLMFRESEIMMRVLEHLRDKEIVGLPIFDAVIVKASKAEEARAVMIAQFKEATGREIRVRLECL